MDGSELFDGYEHHLREISTYRKNYLDTIIEKYVNTDDPGYIIDIRTLKVVTCEGKEAKNVRIPSFGSLNSYFCKPAQQLIEEKKSCLIRQDHKAGEKNFFTCGKKIPTTITVRKNPKFKRDLNFLPHKSIPVDDLSRRSSSFSEISGKEIPRKNPEFKRNLNFFAHKTIPVEDLSRKSSSFSEISHIDKKVTSASNSNCDTDDEELDSVDKLRKGKKIRTTSAVRKNREFKRDLNFFPYKTIPVDDLWKSSRFSKISSNDKKVSSSSDSNGDADNEEPDSVDKMRKGKYPNHRSSILNSYKCHYKELESVNKQRSDDCPAKFQCETLCNTRAAKLQNPYLRKPQIYENSCRDDYEQMDFVGKQKIDECPAKSAFNNGLSIINYASMSSNNVHYVKKLRSKRRTHFDLKNVFTPTKKVSRNMVCNNNILKVPHVILRNLEYSKYIYN